MDTISPQSEESPSVLTHLPRYSPYAAEAQPPAVHIPPLNAALFLLTLLTTTMAGAYAEGGEFSLAHPLQSLLALSTGLSFSVPLMLILFCHEMGHYLTARRNGVDVSLPYFIPAPFPSVFMIGTFGAFIRIKSVPSSRRIMFDIGAAGPWAGVLVAIPTVIVGLLLSHVEPLDQSTGGLNLGNSLLFLGLARLALHVDPNSVNVIMHPMAFAGWLGLFVTTLNLLPVGQLDGGHVTYALFGRRHRLISRLFVLGCVLMVVVPYLLGMDFWAGWLFWVVLMMFLGLGHPTTVDADTPLDPRRRLAAWATVALFILTFSPVPVSYSPGMPPQPEGGKVFDVMRIAPGPGASRIHPRVAAL